MILRPHIRNISLTLTPDVTNKRDYIHHFCYKTEKNDLTDLLWEEICRSTVPTESKDVSNKENIIENK